MAKSQLPKIENENHKIFLGPAARRRKFRTDYHKRAFELEQQKNLKFKVPGRISTYHPIVYNTKKLLEKIDLKKDKFKFWEASREHDILPIHTDIALRPRALRFMDTFIRVLEAIESKITFEYGRCQVEMFGQKTDINLHQKVYRIRDKDEKGWGGESWEPSNKLEFQAGPSYNRKSWIDNDRKKLEEHLPIIIAWIEKDCKYWHHLRAEQAIEENIRLLEKQKLAAIMEAEESETVKVNQLVMDAENWNKAQIIERYINELELQAKQQNKMNSNIKEYIKWARSVVCDFNPLLNKI